MAGSNICWGIEIGAGGIKALKLEQGDSGVNVVDAAIIQHPKTLSTPGIDQNDVLRVSLGTLASQYDLSKAQIAVSVPGHSSFARFAKLPPVEPKKVPQIVKFEAVQQIPFPLEQVEWDYQTFVSPDSPDVEVGIFAITRDRIMERLNMLAEVGIVPNFVQLSPVAVYNALAYDLQFSEQTPGTILLDVGTTSTDLIVAEAGRVWIRTFPIGGHQFTEALVNQFKLSYPKAEKLKREAEEGTNARHVFQAMRPVFTDLAQDVQRSIGYYQSLHKDAKLVRLIGMGSTFGLPGLRKYLKQQLSMDVYRMEEYKRLSFSEIKDEKRQAELKGGALQLATAYGLALQGLGLNAISANLMPTQVLRESMWKSKNKWFATAAGLAVVAGGAMFVRPAMDYMAIAASQRPGEIDSAVSAANEQKSKAEEAGVLGSASTDYRAANMIALLEHRDVYAHLVDDLGQLMTYSEKVAAGWKPAAAEPAKIPEGFPKAYTLKFFRTDYKPAPAEGEGGEEGDGGGKGPGGEGESGEPAAGPALPDDLKAQPRVAISMRVTTTQPGARDFMLATINDWLRKNAVRDGVPYRIIAGPETLFGNIVEEVAIGPGTGAEARPTSITVSTSSGSRTIPVTPRRPTETGRGEDDEGGGRGRIAPGGHGGGGHGGGEEAGAGRGQPERPTRINIGMGEAGEGAGGGGELDKLADLASLRPEDAPGKRVTIEAKWEVVILPPPKPAGEGGETAGDKSNKDGGAR